MPWKKALLIFIDSLLAVYLVLAMTAFRQPDHSADYCRDVDIATGDGESGLSTDGFLGEEQVRQLLTARGLYPLGQQATTINTRSIKDALQASPFIDHATVWQTLSGDIHIVLKQRAPVLRVKADNGDDYYLDNRGSIMPQTTYQTDMPLATGNISRKFATRYLAPIATQIARDPFWRNQTMQINVLPDLGLELVPRVGGHIIYLGRPIKIAQKLQRTRQFYQYGLSRIGWDKYEYINVEFDNQIICKKRCQQKIS